MHKQKGISLIEIVLSLTIIAIIITIAVRYFFIAEENMRVHQTITLIKDITRASYEWRAEHKQPDFNSPNSISIQDLVTLELLHPEEIFNAWGGNILVSPSDDNAHIKITMYKIPFIACRKIQRELNYTQNVDCQQNSKIFTGVF